MSIVLITCKGYSVIRELPSDTQNLPALCREEEVRANDGYAVIASRDGKTIADAEGYIADLDDGREYRSAIDRACGYDAI